MDQHLLKLKIKRDQAERALEIKRSQARRLLDPFEHAFVCAQGNYMQASLSAGICPFCEKPLLDPYREYSSKEEVDATCRCVAIA